MNAIPALLKILVVLAIFLSASNANAFTSLSLVAGSQVQENHFKQFETVNGINPPLHLRQSIVSMLNSLRQSMASTPFIPLRQSMVSTPNSLRQSMASTPLIH